MFGEVVQEKPRALCYSTVNAEDQNAVEMQTGSTALEASGVDRNVKYYIRYHIRGYSCYILAKNLSVFAHTLRLSKVLSLKVVK